MRTILRFIAILALGLTAHISMGQQASPATTVGAGVAPSQTQKNIEAYLRNLYAFGPDVKLIVGPLKESPVEGLLETNIDLTMGENKQALQKSLRHSSEALEADLGECP